MKSKGEVNTARNFVTINEIMRKEREVQYHQSVRHGVSRERSESLLHHDE